MIISVPPPKQRPLTAQMSGFLPFRRETPPKPEGGWGAFFWVVLLAWVFHSGSYRLAFFFLGYDLMCFFSVDDWGRIEGERVGSFLNMKSDNMGSSRYHLSLW
jgi:hypothetical protein